VPDAEEPLQQTSHPGDGRRRSPDRSGWLPPLTSPDHRSRYIVARGAPLKIEYLRAAQGEVRSDAGAVPQL
jgi:hypothetical protein